MTAFTLPESAARTSLTWSLRDRQPALAAAGIAFLGLAAICAALPVVDGRMLDGVSVWGKPAKFFLSSGVFMLTSAWFFGFVRPERRRAKALVASAWTLIGAASFELGYITLQAGQGERSHFNVGDPFHYAMYALMGFAAVAMLLTKIPLAIEIARRPVAGLDENLRYAVVTGIWMTVALGGFAGLYMSQQYAHGHNVGAVGGAVGGAAPFFGWNRLGGDLRVAHFFGMHAEQALPIAAWLAAGAPPPWRRGLVTLAAAAIAAFTTAVFLQALLGRPFPIG